MQNNDYNEFADAVRKLILCDAFDIDINFPVVGKAYFDCLRINDAIDRTYTSPITFSGERMAYPHVTLRLGTVRAKKFSSVLEKLDPYFQNVRPIKLCPQPAILKAPKNSFYFCEVPDKRLIKISNDLLALLDEEMDPPPFPLDMTHPHHITLGVRDENAPIAPVIGSCVSPFIVNRAQIAVKGSYGTCLGVLKTYLIRSR